MCPVDAPGWYTTWSVSSRKRVRFCRTPQMLRTIDSRVLPIMTISAVGGVGDEDHPREQGHERLVGAGATVPYIHRRGAVADAEELPAGEWLSDKRIEGHHAPPTVSQNDGMASTTCPFCKRFSHFTVRWGSVTDGGSLVQIAATCDQCSEPSTGSVAVFPPTGMGDTQDLSWVKRMLAAAHEEEIEWWPRIGVSPEVDDVPESIGRAAKEAYSSRSVGNHMAAVLMARTVVEATAKAKGITEHTLAAKINAMRDAGLIRPAIAELAHEVRFAGNDMAHGDIDVPIDDTDSEEVLALMAEVLSEVFQGPARVARVKAKRQAK